jgi:shikimate kinase
MNIILFGHKGCGKTYVGKRLSTLLGWSFYDTDQLIEDLYKQQTGKELSFRMIYQSEGADFFRQLERQVVGSLQKLDKAIIAVGGGTILDEYSRNVLMHLGTLVFLNTEKNLVKQRLLAEPTLPAYMEKQEFQKIFQQIYEERQPLYHALQEYEVKIDSQSEHDVENRILAILGLQS